MVLYLSHVNRQGGVTRSAGKSLEGTETLQTSLSGGWKEWTVGPGSPLQTTQSLTRRKGLNGEM